MRPVSAEFPVNQPFGSMATQGVAPSSDPDSGVGYYVHLYGNYQPFGHAGCDIACPEGTPVHAMAAGTVLWADWGTKLPGDDSWGPSGYFRRWALYKGFPGIVTVIQHDGWIGVYAHLSAAWMNPSDRVTEGQQIGLSGGTGGVAPHLHVEALIDLSYPTGGGLIYGRTNPEPFFGGIAAMGGTITPLTEAEDDMGILDEPITRQGGGPLDGEPTTLRAMIAYFDANQHYTREAIKATVAATVGAVFQTKINRQGGASGQTDLAATLAYLDANLNKLDATQIMDPAVVAAAVSKAAEAALKDITVTLSSAPGSK